ncbi:transcription factor bHLH96-like [Quercus lobata]|uniref:BHLH domain-containing protein n=1 Tax=Quercus lobata TaxID=97700 RepID=A0A7N2KRD3_QUELO|nr:transcription factor bHLH96-like [Quercus lobata]
MALEAVVYPQDPFSLACKDFYSWSYDLALQEEDKALLGIHSLEQSLHANFDYSSSPSVMQNAHKEYYDPNSSSPEVCTDHTIDQYSFPGEVQLYPLPSKEAFATTTTTGRRKRRRTKCSKNKEEIENQRMTHIAVERNRRKQMNEYLSVLRSLMPPSYVQRGDQASIIGGAINFVKELEQLLQSMEVHKRTKQEPDTNGFSSSSSPFAQFFSFPQYSTRATQCNDSPATATGNESMAQQQQQNQWAVADIEVTMVESHANLKILSKQQPRQLLKMVAGLQSLRLTILHLNVTTIDQMVLYSVSVKVEEGCQLNTVDEIATAVNQMLRRIQEESAFS